MNPNMEKQGGFPAQPQVDYQYQQPVVPPQQPGSPPPAFSAVNVAPQHTGISQADPNYPPVQQKIEQYLPQQQQQQQPGVPVQQPQQGYYAPGAAVPQNPGTPAPYQVTTVPVNAMQQPGPYAPVQQQQGYVQQPTGAPGAAASGQQQYRVATPISSLGQTPAPVDCPNCHERCMTNVSYHAGNTTHAWAVGLCCFTGICCFVPYLMNSLKDVQHRCGKCGLLLATTHKSGQVDVHAHA